MRDDLRSAIEHCVQALGVRETGRRIGCSHVAVGTHRDGRHEPGDTLGQAYRELARELGWEDGKQSP